MLYISQQIYIKLVLKSVHIDHSKYVRTSLAAQFILDQNTISTTTKEKCYMIRVPYSSDIGSVMYVMVSIIPDLAHIIRVVSKFMSNIGKAHFEAVKWIIR